MKMFKKFNKIFDKIASGKHETHTIFKDWLNMTIDKWTLPNNKPLFTQNKRYTQQEYNYFAELYFNNTGVLSVRPVRYISRRENK